MTILIGIPTYDDTVKTGLASALLGESRQPGCPPYTVAFKQASLLALAHNALLCLALNNRPEVSHLLIVHSDVAPKPGFLVGMYDEIQRTGADVLSVLLPIKDGKGLTSTALLRDTDSTLVGVGAFHRRRLTMREAVRLPETFGAAELAALFGDESAMPILLANTGLMLIDVMKPFAERVHFTINDTIRRDESGHFVAEVEPEDWYFSSRAASEGARVMVTRKISAKHCGRANFPNAGAWGEWEHDETAAPLMARRNGQEHETLLQGSLS